MPDLYVAPLELKFVSDANPGEFEGYGAVYGNKDSHGDVIAPGAFGETLAKHVAAGTMPMLHVEHDWIFGGDPLPAGVWTSLEEDSRGLHGKGKISALDTDYGRRVHALMKDGALKGLSIVFSVPPGGSDRGKKSGEPSRQLNRIDLHALDIVKMPSNAEAQIVSVKGAASINYPAVTQAIAAAIQLHCGTMRGGDSPTSDERLKLLAHLQDAHEALTGFRMPSGMKSIPQTLREFETALRDMGLSKTDARVVATHGFKSGRPALRDEVGRPAFSQESQDAADAITAALKDFSLPRLF